MKEKFTPKHILAPHKPGVRALVSALRRLIKETVPGVEERAYPGWHAIGYSHSDAGYFCGVFPYESSVKIYFENGAFLPDPDRLFTGGGKKVRFILIEKPQDIRTGPFRKLLGTAVRFGASQD